MRDGVQLTDQERIKLIQKRGPCKQEPSAARREDFLTRCNEEVASESLDVDHHVRQALGSINQHLNNLAGESRRLSSDAWGRVELACAYLDVDALCKLDHRLDIVDRAGNVRDVCYCKQLGSEGDCFRQRAVIYSAVRRDRHVPQNSTGPLGNHLPADEVIVVLSCRDDYFISFL